MRRTSPIRIRASRGTSVRRTRRGCRASASTSCVSASSGRPSNRERVVPTSPRSARPALPGIPHEFNRAVAERYLAHVAATVQAARPLRDLHPPRHAPGRLQHELPRRGSAQLGRVHQQRADRAERGPVVEQLCESPAADGHPTLLGQRRGGRSPGQLRSRVGNRGRLLQERSLGRRLRPLQRALLDRDAGRVRIDLHRPAGVLLHGEGPHRASWPTGPLRWCARPTCRETASSRRSRPSTTTT